MECTIQWNNRCENNSNSFLIKLFIYGFDFFFLCNQFLWYLKFSDSLFMSYNHHFTSVSMCLCLQVYSCVYLYLYMYQLNTSWSAAKLEHINQLNQLQYQILISYKIFVFFKTRHLNKKKKKTRKIYNTIKNINAIWKVWHRDSTCMHASEGKETVNLLFVSIFSWCMSYALHMFSQSMRKKNIDK